MEEKNIENQLQEKQLKTNRRVNKTIVEKKEHFNEGVKVGEETNVISSYAGVSEKDYFKVYTDTLCDLLRLPNTEKDVMLSFFNQIDYNNILCLNTKIRSVICQELGISKRTLERCITSLKRKNAIIPYVDEMGQLHKGIYITNPWIGGKGTSKQLEMLRCKIKPFVVPRRVQIDFKEDNGVVKKEISIGIGESLDDMIMIKNNELNEIFNSDDLDKTLEKFEQEDNKFIELSKDLCNTIINNSNNE